MEQRRFNKVQLMEVQFLGGEYCSVSLFTFEIVCDGLMVENSLNDAKALRDYLR